MKTLAPALFSVPKAPPRTQVSNAEAEAFVQAEKPAAIVADVTPPPPAIEVATSPKAGVARLSVDVPCSTLRALKIRAIERGTTVREYVLEMLDREHL